MSERSDISSILKSPFIFENWRARDNAKMPTATYEFELLSDAAFVGETTFGPYRLINTVAHASGDPDGRSLAPVIVLRVDQYIEYSVPDMTQTDQTIYHGGSLVDEVAAVLSIWTGARVIAGGMTREFRPHDRDEKGRPLAHNGFGQPPSFSRKARASHIPSAVQVHSINQMEGFCSTSLVDPANEVALIRAARMYQEGLWIAESEPALSWLLFVSAAEVIAGRWDQKRAAPIDSLKASKPNLVKKVEMLCPDLVPFLADELAEISGATRKFVNFLLRFKPDAPAVRPPVYSQVNWEPKKLKSAFQQVYGYRSKALHAGIPFPAPMCSLPLRFPDEAPGFTEKPFGLAQSRAGGVWLEKDLPMLLHTFEYILRNSVIAWWKELTRSD